MKRWPIFLVLAAVLLLAAGVQAQDSIAIVVRGVGDARVSPDTAMVWLGVSSSGDQAGEALKESYDVVARLQPIFRDYAPEDRIKTTEFYLYRSDRYDSRTNEFLPGPFIVRHVFEVPVSELSRAAEMIDRAVAAGANIIQNIQYVIQNSAEATAEAYRRALEQAYWKAEILMPAGYTLELREVRDSYTSYPMFAAEGGAAVTEMADMFMPGQLKVSVNLEVVFAAVPLP